MKPKIHSTYGFALDADYDKTVEIWLDTFQGIQESTAEVKIFILVEPNEVSGLNQNIISRQDLFTKILSYDERVLNAVTNGMLFEYGTKWVEIEKYDFPEKTFSVSNVCGHKTLTKNHHLRKQLWYRQEEIKIPRNFFISQYGGIDYVEGAKTLGDSKFPMFESMFHICIENTCRKYLFTEKINDAILCKSIPIYLGCPNIDQYYDKQGLFQVDSVDEIIELCNKLTENDYQERLPFIEENHKRAFNWIDYPARLNEKILEIIK